MCLCLPKPENTSWYVDVSFVTAGSVEALVWLSGCFSFSWVALVRCSSPSSTLVSRLRSGRDLVVPLATRKWAVVFFPVLMLSISASKHPMRGRGSCWANVYRCVSVGFNCILFLSELWSFSSLSSSIIFAVEHESASNFSFTPLIRTATVVQLQVCDCSARSWNAKSESDESSCSSCRTYFAVDCGFRWGSFGLFFPLHIRAKWPFFEQALHVFPDAGQFDRGPLWSSPQNWQLISFLLSCAGLGLYLFWGFHGFFWWTLCTCFRAEGSVSSIFWAWRSISSLLAVCSNSCWSVYLFTIASRRSFLSCMVCRILLRITASGSVKSHFVTWSRKRMWYWATDSPSFWHIFSNLLRAQSGLTIEMKWLLSLVMIFSYSFRFSAEGGVGTPPSDSISSRICSPL